MNLTAESLPIRPYLFVSTMFDRTLTTNTSINTERCCGNAQGFTLIELIAVLVITAILAAVALPRFMQSNTFDTFGYTEQTSQMIRFAQKNAIAKRRSVCVVITSATVSLGLASAVNSNTCNSTLKDPAGGAAYVLNTPNGITVTPISFIFNASGQPLSSTGVALTSTQDIAITGDSTRHIYVEAETGYVY